MRALNMLVTGLVFVSLCQAAVITKEFDTKGLETLILNNESGDIEITATKTAKAVVTAEKVLFDINCQLTMDWSGDTLEIKVEKKRSRTKCEVKFNVKVPSGISVDLKAGSSNILMNGQVKNIDFVLGSGNFSFKGRASDVKGNIGSGDIVISGTTEDVRLQTGSGNVVATGLTEGGRIQTGSGNVELTLAKVPPKGELVVSTGSGNTKVFLPANAKVEVTFQASSGRLKLEKIHSNPKHGYKIKVEAGSGNLDVITKD